MLLSPLRSVIYISDLVLKLKYEKTLYAILSSRITSVILVFHNDIYRIGVNFFVVWERARQLTSGKQQDEDQAAQNQRDGERKKATKDRAPDSLHCVQTICLCKCVCVRSTFINGLCEPSWITADKQIHVQTHADLFSTAMLQACTHSSCIATLFQCKNTEDTVRGQKELCATESQRTSKKLFPMKKRIIKIHLVNSYHFK